jgi:polar amino acid transport system substrate-binding protein
MLEKAAVRRRTVLKAGVAVLAGARGARADALAEVNSRGELVCATNMNFAPFDFLVNNEYAGVDRDLIDEVGMALHVHIRYLDMPWTSVLPGLEEKKFDFVIAPVTVTSERMRRYSFTVPIAEATVTLMKRADDSSIGKPDDIAGKTVGGQKGSSQLAQLVEWAKSLPKPITVAEYTDNDQSYIDLAAGRIDAVVGSLPNLSYVAARQRETFTLVLPPFGKRSFYSWAGRLGPDDQPLTNAISAVLVQMDEDGRMAAIQKKWFGQAFSLPRNVPQPAM